MPINCKTELQILMDNISNYNNNIEMVNEIIKFRPKNKEEEESKQFYIRLHFKAIKLSLKIFSDSYEKLETNCKPEFIRFKSVLEKAGLLEKLVKYEYSPKRKNKKRK